MNEKELEQAFDLIAEGIDRAGTASESLFLAKLALLLAHRHGNLEDLRGGVDDALQDLEPGS